MQPDKQDLDDTVSGIVCFLMVIAATVAWGWAGLCLGLAFLLFIRTLNSI